MTFLQDLIALAVILSIVVIVHEFGHFAVAKLFKFPVEVFSLGFGKRLFGVRWHGTDYRVSLLPLGGYVRVPGLGPDESTTVGALPAREQEIAGTRWQRGLIMFAGPVMNFALAIVLLAGVYMAGMRVPAYLLKSPVVSSIAPDSPAVVAGFEKGDRILFIGTRPIETWQDADFQFAISPRQPLKVVILRGAEQKVLRVTPRGYTKFDIGNAGVGPAFLPRIMRVVPGSPAARAGLKAGDVIRAIDGEVMTGIQETVDAVNRRAPGPETLSVLRGGENLTLSVLPHKEAAGWKMGVELAPDVPEVLQKYPPPQAVRQAWRELRTDTRATVGVIMRLFAGRASVKQLSGPISIGQFAGEAARAGVVPFIAFTSMLSLELGILNLFPVPMLDGGQLAIILIEGTIRRDLSLRVKEWVLQFGFLLIVVLMVVVIYNDILKVF